MKAPKPARAPLPNPSFDPRGKYASFRGVELAERRWPNKTITKAPRWCSVDLRDGNQALVNPMDLAKKLEMYRLLVELGFREIEIGFPSASQTEFDFTRALVEQDLLGAEVVPQVLTQCRPHLIERTFEALEGMSQAIVHIYNSTSTVQRRVVFGLDRAGIVDIAVKGAELVKSLAAKSSTAVTVEYSPESFTGTELEFALEICNEVISVCEPTPERKMIINLPATVEMSTPNIYADMIEWFDRKLSKRDSVILSVHTHNDRGTGVAATELALLAGADRVEGTLFGNGERTGNVDIVTLALNLYTQGIDPGLDLRDLNRIMEISQRCTEIPVHVRHPYAGELVFTAFSGSHQDAIRKGMLAQQRSSASLWEVPYLPIDPSDIGRRYEPIIRINSQSGKGGVAYIMEAEFGCQLPKAMHPEFSAVIQRITDKTSREILPQEVWQEFVREYIEVDAPFRFKGFTAAPSLLNPDSVECCLSIEHEGNARQLRGSGNGPIDACMVAFAGAGYQNCSLRSYLEHAIGSGSDSRAIAYIEVEGSGGVRRWGAGIDTSIERASIKALVSALNRLMSYCEASL